MTTCFVGRVVVDVDGHSFACHSDLNVFLWQPRVVNRRWKPVDLVPLKACWANSTNSTDQFQVHGLHGPLVTSGYDRLKWYAVCETTLWLWWFGIFSGNYQVLLHTLEFTQNVHMHTYAHARARTHAHTHTHTHTYTHTHTHTHTVLGLCQITTRVEVETASMPSLKCESMYMYMCSAHAPALV